MSRWLPQAASAHAALLDAVLVDIHWHMLAVFVVWLAIFVTALVRFRAGRHPDPRGAGPRLVWPALAIGLVVLGDAAVLFARALPAWRMRLTPLEAGVEPPLEIRIAAEQFAWHVHYPGTDGRFGRTSASLISASNPVGIDREDPSATDDVGLTNVLVLPIDRTIVLELTSRDVVHSLTLPEMRVKQDVTPGMTSHTWFTPIVPGSWEIGCSQLCGLGHYRMRGQYRVVTQAKWEAWIASETARLTSGR